MPVNHQYARNVDIPFVSLSDLFDECQTILVSGVGSRMRQVSQRIKKWMEQHMNRRSPDTFQVMRLFCPERDRTRGVYKLKEAELRKTLVEAVTVPKNKTHERELKSYGNDAEARGHFHNTAYRVILQPFCGILDSKEFRPRAAQLTVERVNEELDKLAAARSKHEKAAVLRHLMENTTASMMKWLLNIILLDLKIGRSSDYLLRLYHKDALDLWSLTQDLKRVCEELLDPNKPMPRKDIEPGCAVDPMKASSVYSVQQAHKLMQGKPYVVEIKLDGERLLVHKTLKKDEDGNESYDIKYTSRRGFEHGAKSDFNVLDRCIQNQILPQNVILDGEIIVWNKSKCNFEPFGTVRSTVNCAKEEKPLDAIVPAVWHGAMHSAAGDYLPPRVTDVELLYVVFDILYTGEESHIRKPLSERQKLLQDAVGNAPLEGWLVGPDGSNVRGRVVPLLPGVQFTNKTLPFSVITQDQEVLQDMCDRAFAAGEEGVVVKRLDSLWQYGKRTLDWLKLKPDYLSACDIDAVILGATHGKGRNVGTLHEFILGLPIPSLDGGPPTMFETFCRVGQGLTDAEYARVGEMLREAGFRDYRTVDDKPKNYRATRNNAEKVDLWVVDVMKSLVLTVKADIRTIRSRAFASCFSLRFPRIVRVRYDKTPQQCTTAIEIDQQLKMYIASLDSKGHRDGADGDQGGKARGKKSQGQAQEGTQYKAELSKVPQHLLPADVSDVLVEHEVLKDSEGRALRIHFMNYGPHGRADLQALVKKLGGVTQMSLPDIPDKQILCLAHVIKPTLMQAVMEQGHYDILTIGWLYDCKEQQKWVEPMPRHYLFIKPQTRLNSKKMDMHGVPLWLDLDVQGQDMRQLLSCHVDKRLVEKKRAELIKGEKQLARRHKMQLKEEAGTVADTKPIQTLKSLMMSIDDELAGVGLFRPQTSLFLSKVLYFLDLWSTDESPEPAAATLAHRQPSGAELNTTCTRTTSTQRVPSLTGLSTAAAAAAARSQLKLHGQAEAAACAAEWEATAHELQLDGLKLQVTALGGEVQETLGPGVTHIVLVPPGLDLLESPSLRSSPANDADPGSSQQQAGETREETGRWLSAEQVLTGLQEAAMKAARAVTAEDITSGKLAGDQEADVITRRAKRLLAHVRLRLVDGRIRMVHPSWVTVSCSPPALAMPARQAADQGSARRLECEAEDKHRPWVTRGPGGPAADHPGQHQQQGVGEVARLPRVTPAETSTLGGQAALQAAGAGAQAAPRPRQSLASVFVDTDSEGDMEQGGVGAAAGSGMGQAGAGGLVPGSARVSGVPRLQNGIWVGSGAEYICWPWEILGLAHGDGQANSTCSSAPVSSTDGSGDEGKQLIGRRGSRGRNRKSKVGAVKLEDGLEETADEAGVKGGARGRRGGGKGRGRGRGRGKKSQAVDDDDMQVEAVVRRSRPPGYAAGGKRPRLASLASQRNDATAPGDQQVTTGTAGQAAGRQDLEEGSGSAVKRPRASRAASGSQRGGVHGDAMEVLGLNAGGEMAAGGGMTQRVGGGARGKLFAASDDEGPGKDDGVDGDVDGEDGYGSSGPSFHPDDLAASDSDGGWPGAGGAGGAGGAARSLVSGASSSQQPVIDARPVSKVAGRQQSAKAGMEPAPVASSVAPAASRVAAAPAPASLAVAAGSKPLQHDGGEATGHLLAAAPSDAGAASRASPDQAAALAKPPVLSGVAPAGTAAKPKRRGLAALLMDTDEEDSGDDRAATAGGALASLPAPSHVALGPSQQLAAPRPLGPAVTSNVFGADHTGRRTAEQQPADFVPPAAAGSSGLGGSAVGATGVQGALAGEPASQDVVQPSGRISLKALLASKGWAQPK